MKLKKKTEWVVKEIGYKQALIEAKVGYMYCKKKWDMQKKKHNACLTQYTTTTITTI